VLLAFHKELLLNAFASYGALDEYNIYLEKIVCATSKRTSKSRKQEGKKENTEEDEKGEDDKKDQIKEVMRKTGV